METTTKTRTNAYAANCVRCNTQVPAGAGSLTKAGGAWEVRHLGTCPEATPVATTAPTAASNGQDNEIGVYVLNDGGIVKVQPNKAKTRVYAMRWIEINGERLVDATEERVHGEWTYEAGLIGRVATARRMTLDEAKQFILRFGVCVRCSRRLKAAESVEAGIGPICRRYFSLAPALPSADEYRVVPTEPATPAPAASTTWQPWEPHQRNYSPGSRAGGLWDDRVAAEADAEIAAWSEIFNK